jgi:hypothetical protein
MAPAFRLGHPSRGRTPAGWALGRGNSSCGVGDPPSIESSTMSRMLSTSLIVSLYDVVWGIIADKGGSALPYERMSSEPENPRGAPGLNTRICTDGGGRRREPGG